MSPTSQTALSIPPSHPMLELVRHYIRLIDHSDRLIGGRGLKVLYGVKAGLVSLNDGEVEAIVNKADRAGMIPKNLEGFLTNQIFANIALYAQELRDLIEQRVIAIGNGDVRNPDAQVSYSPQAARRLYYIPPNYVLKRVQDALTWWDCPSDLQQMKATTLALVRTDVLLTLINTEGRAGHSTPNPSSYGALIGVVEALVRVTQACSENNYRSTCYKEQALPALQILWALAKLLLGDLRPQADRGDINEIDLSNTKSISDGTLAAIPFPTARTAGIFYETDTGFGLSMKARFYLNAVSKVALSSADTHR